MAASIASKGLTRRQVLATAAVVAASARSQTAPTKPNILFIMADDLGYADLSCYGRREYRTPNIDSLAARGMKFMQAYANSAVCSATRTALMTGRYQYRLPIGLEEPILTGSTRDAGIPADHPTLPSLLKKAGYGTTLVGKYHLGYLPKYSPLKNGYDHFWGYRSGGVDYFTHQNRIASAPNSGDLWEEDVKIDKAGYMTDLLGDRAITVIDGYAKAKQPFLLSLHFSAPHWPWEGPEDQAESLRVKNLFDFDGGSNKTYAAMVTRLDFQVGRVLKKLETAGLASNTIVIFTSDNGGERFSNTWPFTGKKTELLEGGLRIPALVRWPGRVRAGSVSEQVAITMDWVPTLLAAAGTQADAAYAMDGINLLPALTQNAAPVSRKLFWRYRYNAQRAMRDGNMKWLKVNQNDFLFNVIDDPLERANLKERQPEVYQRMVAEFTAWNATMLAEDPNANTTAFWDDELADHPDNRR